MVAGTSTLLARSISGGAGTSAGWANDEFAEHDFHKSTTAELQDAVLLGLDRLCGKYSGDDYSDLTSDLMDMLQVLRQSTSAKVWQDCIMPAARAHEIGRRMHQCPFTRHSYSRPRGYPGDAELIDFVYKHPDTRALVDAATSAGRSVFNVTVNVSGCEAVRRRKEVLARKIDEVASERSNAEVLAVACGHLREAENSVALKEGGIARLLATDQDQISLGKADRYRSTICSNIEVRNLTVRNFITARHGLGTFDLVYAAGLYDYLDPRVAARLTSSLFGLLKSGGRLLIPNFLTGLNQEAYMEVYMDWYLLYRTRAEIEAFSEAIPRADIANTDYFEDDMGTIGYLEIQRT
jgi:extracellular factor (EF) 3-hydroxypalmitic acid methyl ester biosynthesis protein